MNKNILTFGRTITIARKKKGLLLRECAAQILKDDMTPISVQYLSDIENDRRTAPPEYIIEQLAAVLDIPIEVLCYYGRLLPRNYVKSVSHETIISAYGAFLEVINKDSGQ